MRNTSHNQSVLRAFVIVEYLAASHGWVGLRKLARDLGLGPATASRFLASLKEMGYVKQHPVDARYRLTLKFAWIASLLLEQIQLRGVARPWMERLAASSNEAVHLTVIEDGEVVYVDKVNSKQAVEMRSRTGSRACVHSTAAGRAILAFLPAQEREAMLASLALPAMTKKTITEPDALRGHLERVRRQGYAVDDEENEVGIRCVGAPLFDHTGCVVGAVSISGWTITMTPERIPQLAAELQEACRAISSELGYPGRELAGSSAEGTAGANANTG